jgi:hypothetical protein
MTKHRWVRALMLALGLSLTTMQCTCTSPCRIIGGPGDDAACAIVQAYSPVDGYVVAGWTKRDGKVETDDGIVVRLGKEGVPDKAIRTDGDEDEQLLSLVRAAGIRGYAAAGWTRSRHPSGMLERDVLLLQLDSSLQRHWGKVYHLVGGGDLGHTANSVIEVSDAHGGGYALVGQVTVAGEYQVLVLRVDKNGEVMWSRRLWLEGRHWHDGLAVCEVYHSTFPAVFVVAGECSDSIYTKPPNHDAFVMRLDDKGIPVGASIVLAGARDDEARSLLLDANAVIVAGSTGSFGGVAPHSNIWVAGLAGPEGQAVWSRVYYWDSAGNNEFLLGDRALAPTCPDDSLRGYVVAGVTYSRGPGTPDEPNIIAIKVNRNGTIGWNGQATIHPSATEDNKADRAFAVTPSQNIPNAGPGYAIVGQTNSFSPGRELGGSNIHFATLDRNGKRLSCTLSDSVFSDTLVWTSELTHSDSLLVSADTVGIVPFDLSSQEECEPQFQLPKCNKGQ